MLSSDFSTDAPIASSDLLAELDIALIAALYRAANGPDSYDNLVDVLQERYQSSNPLSRAQLRPAVDRELDTIDSSVAKQGVSISSDPLERAVEEVPTAAVILDSFGKVILANELGSTELHAHTGRDFDFNLIDPTYRSQFSRFLSGARERGNQRRIIVRLDPYYLQEEGDETEPKPVQLAEALIVEAPRRASSFVAVRLLDIPWTSTVDDQLQEAFGLTGAECEISQLYYRLRDTRTVADRRGTSMATVQTQLKSICAKTQSNGQAQLLQVLSLLCARANLDKVSRLAGWANPLGREATFTRSDGRKIAYSWQGLEGGDPVVVVHGQSLGHMLPPEAENIFARAGFRLWILSRPGFGHSERNESLRAMDDHALAIAEFYDHLGIHGAPVMTVSSGLVGLSRALERNPELASAIVNVGYLWNGELELTGRLPTQQRIIFHMARYTPKLLRTVVGIAYRNVKRDGVDWYINRLLGGIKVDETFFRSGRHAGLIRAAANHLLIQGADVYCRELQQTRDPWLSALRATDIPMLFLLPEHDSIHDYGEYTTQLDLGQNADFSLLSGAGELYFYKAAQAIAERAVEHFKASQNSSRSSVPVLQKKAS